MIDGNALSQSARAAARRPGRNGRETHHYPQKSVLIVDDEYGIRNFLVKGLSHHFGLVEFAEDVEQAEAIRRRCHFDLIIADIRLPGTSGVEWVSSMRGHGSTTAVIFITAHADLETAIAALRAGAADFIMKPFRMEQMLASIERCMERQQIQRENIVLKREVDKLFDPGIVGESESIRSLLDMLRRLAPTGTTVLLEGESGTGKELAARALHRWSGRGGSFVPINCGAMTEDLMESELFGHLRGAFTGANQNREGLFNYASGGTVFLDEIGEMPLSMQVHLLRVLETRTIRQVGANRETPVDVRVVAATNRDLEERVEQGLFREDLFYRLNVVSVRIPPLRERIEDLPLLVRHFVSALASDMGLPEPALSFDAFDGLDRYDWPGNVRELKNVIERCLLLGKAPAECVTLSADAAGRPPAVEATGEQLEEVVKAHILKILEREGGNKSAAARVLGVSRKTLERKVNEWGS